MLNETDPNPPPNTPKDAGNIPSIHNMERSPSQLSVGKLSIGSGSPRLSRRSND